MAHESRNKFSRTRVAAVTLVVGLFFSVPLLFLLYGGLAAALFGLAFITVFGLLQLPLFLFLRHKKLLPQFSFGLPEDQTTAESGNPHAVASQTELTD